MAVHAMRSPEPEPREPVLVDLPPIRCDGLDVGLKLLARRSEGGMWRGRLVFSDGLTELARESAEIFCGASEKDLWQSVRDLREHHLRDLYRSLV